MTDPMRRGWQPRRSPPRSPVGGGVGGAGPGAGGRRGARAGTARVSEHHSVDLADRARSSAPV